VPSSGFHSNGYSLIRKAAFEHAGLTPSDTVAEIDGRTVGDILLTPTRIYSATVQAAIDAVGNAGLHAIAHITGGGIAENLERVLPAGVEARINLDSWQIAPAFRWLQKLGNIAEDEMFRVFNMGLGLILSVPADCSEAVRQACSTDQYPAVELGTVVAASSADAEPKASLIG
jgi:phosphoribosylformylglycinamidine cyclo-ligase